MRAIQFDYFGQRPELREVPKPAVTPGGVVVRVETTGLCRSDVHGWLGHDGGIALPHVPGHELVGVIESVGPEVKRFGTGERVTVPFVCACGTCPECLSGNAQVCRNQTQPGFTHWGSYAELVALHDADNNLIPVPADLDSGAAALLGCRFATAYRGMAHQANLKAGERLLVVGCGGVGLSAVMIGVALGAQVVAVDVNDEPLERARNLGAFQSINSRGMSPDSLVQAIKSLVPAGIDVSVDALGRAETAAAGILSLLPRGRHVQIGLFPSDPVLPMSAVIAKELTILGSHGMPAKDYSGLLSLVASKVLRPEKLIERRITLEQVPDALMDMAGDTSPAGVTVIDIAPARRSGTAV
ncbi:zinc-dependent alcohol dehydrogenase family protein [Paenarthrobacter sp. Z7-10]|uniref:zinc-dependent alcohol dehydrogenase family protein n=1 Tax=Paenarthrobacter sp. Z7-10 TaxID=2787635 RepID=UPI0022A90BD7|nr:zinc-dependent alcohol dehydrogenase family protein [Paenarthrobacter sp. Z7-10]MCZ2402227.1 zinc-dependent alcohol dehydrogenase family protein [Paenarthrobacter sp. Z7-10]